MKNFNLIKRLFMDSHEKQSPQRFGRYAVMLIMLLTLGVGQMWGAWIGNSGINVNGTWYRSTNNIDGGSWLASCTYFQDNNFGAITSLVLGGQYDTWDDNKTDYCSWNANNGIHILIKKGSTTIADFKLSCYHDSKSGNNNVWKTSGGTGDCSDSGSWGTYPVDLSGYAAGNDYTIKVTWFSPSGQSLNNTAKFTIDPVVTFKANGGTGSDYTQRVTYNTNTALTANTFTKTGYNFAGWATTADGSVAYADKANVKLTAHTNLFAKWTEKTYSLTFSHNGHGTIAVGGSTIASGSTASVNYSTTKTLVATPSTGYNFSGWTKSGTNASAVTIGNASNASTTIKATNTGATVTAGFTAKTYSITLDGNGGSDGSATATYNSSTLTSFTGSSRASYDLNGYFTATSGGTKVINADGTLVASAGSYTNSSSQWIYDNNVELHAQWTYNPVTYSVTYAVGTGYSSFGSLSAKNTSTSAAIVSGSSLESGTGVTFTATPNTGYVVEGWYTNAACTAGKHDEGNNTYSTTLSGNITVYVKFVEKTWSVAFAAGTGGTVTTPAATPQTVGQVTGISIEATPATGYTFNNWTITSGSGSFTSAATTNSNTFKPTAASTITASFNETKSTITVTTANSSQGTLKFGSTSKSWGATASLGVATTQEITATAAAGFRFVRWDLSGAAASSSTLTNTTITLKADGSGSAGTATAVFEEDLSSRWHLVGNSSDFPDGWNINSTTMMQKKTGHSTESVVYFTVDVTSTDTKEFKIVDDNGASDDIWYGYSSGDTYLTWTATATNNVYAKDDGGTDHNKNNLKYTPTVTGPYEFKVDYSGTYPAVTITYPTSYTVTYSVSPAGAAGAITTSPSFSSGDLVLSGTSVTFTHASANSGYTWYRWENGSGSNLGTGSTYNTSISANTTVVAKYTENNYTVTVAAGAGGSVAGTSVQGHVSTKVTLPTATPSTGYYFTGWEVTSGTATLTSASSATAAQINGMTDAVTVRANFAPIWALVGTMNSWNPATNTLGNFTTTSSKDYGYVDVDLNANTQYSFKIKNVQTSAFYKPTSSNTEITYANKATAQGMNNTAEGNPNQTIKTAGKGTYRFTWNATDHSIKVTYPTSYTVTFGYGTGGSAVTASVESSGAITSGQYAAAGKDITFTQTPSSSGYTFKGWYTAASGGTAVSGMSTSDNVLDDIAANATVYAQYTANTYTVTFDNNGGTVTPSPTSKSVTFGSAYGELPSGMKHTSKQFIGWYTDPDDGEGTHITAETIVSTASDHTLYAQYESVYAVNVDFKCGDAKVYPSTVVSASPTSLTPTITAPEIFGYSFVNWTGTNVSPASATSATTTITATAATTITANYAEVPTVYFKNNLGWDSVFVSFDITWTTAGGKQVPNNSGKPYYAMKQIGTTDIYYCEIPSTYTASNYASWSANIAFDNQNYNHKATTTHTGNMTSFYQGEFTGRGDFDPKATLFIPYNGDKDARNSGTFYQTGCWMKYNSTESGYQVNMNTMVSGNDGDTLTVKLTAANAGGYEFSAKLNLKHPNYTYGFKLYKDYQKSSNDIWYTNTGTIYASTESLPWHFWAGSGITFDSQRCGLHTEALGDYTITVSFATGRPEVNVEYPTQVGDWRLAYNDRIAWSGDTHDASWYIYSRVIKAKANAVDTVSFYVSKATGANASVELQKCTEIDPSTGAETWTKQGSNLDLSGLPGTGIYNFEVTQNGSKVVTSAVSIGGYEGNFYIRTDASDGGWNNYISSGKNVMTYSEYAKDNSGFTHYFMRFVNTGTNIKFCIANDYSPCLTEYCIDDDYTGEYIAIYGNVRFMWDHRTNVVSRAYISGSSVISDRFLVLEGNTMIMAEDGTPLAIAGLNANEKNFADDQNWIYEATIKAKPTARVKLTAKFNNQVQYFKGSEGAFAEGTTVQLIGGTGDDAYKIRVIYDFKTNRLVGAWLPDDETVISSDWPIDADIMVLRYHQEGAKQIKFSGSGALSDVKTVYGAMQFNKYRVNNKSEAVGHANLGLSNYERDLYWISFPFEVKLSDVFGFGTYGKHWIIEYYDGKTRAANGFWADSDPNWKFVTPSMRNNGYVLEANQGYILALDLDNMTEESDVWAYGTENVYLYFPSTAHVSDIDAMDSKTIDIDQTGYECTINRGTPDGDRRVKDSYWHVLGVPSYANASHETANAWTGTVPNIDPDNWTSSAPYVYEWVPLTNRYTVHSSSSMTFLPMHSYFAQYAQTTITWTNINATPPAALVARRNAARKSNYEFRMEMTLGDEVADQTYVSLRDDEAVTNEFDFSYDLSKITNGSFAKTNCIYTLIGYERAAANCLPLETEATTIVPVGVNIATAGEYTIAIPSGTSGVGVTLVDNETGLRTNLALEDYTVTLEAGTQDDRFYLEISPIKHVATGIEDITGNGSQVTGARKVMVDGILYIIKDGKVFSTQGARVK